MSKSSNCAQTISGATGAPQSAVAKTIQQIQQLAQSYPSYAANPSAALKQAATYLNQQNMIAAVMKRRAKQINIARNSSLSREITNWRQLRQATVGDTSSDFKSGASTDAQAISAAEGAVSSLDYDFRKAGVLEKVVGRGLIRRRDKPFELAVRREIDILRGKPEAPTGNPAAVAAAKVAFKHLEGNRLALNNEGAYIDNVADLVDHEPAKIAKNKIEWINDVGNWFDPAMFQGTLNKSQFLDDLWANFAAGNHLKPVGQFTGDFGIVGAGKDMAQFPFA